MSPKNKWSKSPQGSNVSRGQFDLVGQIISIVNAIFEWVQCYKIKIELMYIIFQY